MEAISRKEANINRSIEEIPYGLHMARALRNLPNEIIQNTFYTSLYLNHFILNGAVTSHITKTKATFISIISYIINQHKTYWQSDGLHFPKLSIDI